MKANKTIRWKVVDKERRTSIVVDKVPGYGKKYIENKITKASYKTLGLMCFERKIDAINFIAEILNKPRFRTKIIKVKTFGKGIRPSLISVVDVGKEIKQLKNWYENPQIRTPYILGGNSRIAPKGTICYPAVMPLE